MTVADRDGLVESLLTLQQMMMKTYDHDEWQFISPIPSGLAAYSLTSSLVMVAEIR